MTTLSKYVLFVCCARKYTLWMKISYVSNDQTRGLISLKNINGLFKWKSDMDNKKKKKKESIFIHIDNTM